MVASDGGASRGPGGAEPAQAVRNPKKRRRIGRDYTTRPGDREAATLAILHLLLVAWRAHVPWATDAQVEQDLVITRALIEIFRDPHLAAALAFHGNGFAYLIAPSARSLRASAASMASR